MNRTDRLYALVEELRAVAPQWRSARWFAERFEVSSRTIERDLSALQQAGVPIYATPGRRGGYAIDVQHTLPPLNLSAAEVAAVATALAADTATPFTHAGRTALQKILAVLGEVDAEGVRALASRVRLFDRAEGQSSGSLAGLGVRPHWSVGVVPVAPGTTVVPPGPDHRCGDVRRAGARSWPRPRQPRAHRTGRARNPRKLTSPSPAFFANTDTTLSPGRPTVRP